MIKWSLLITLVFILGATIPNAILNFIHRGAPYSVELMRDTFYDGQLGGAKGTLLAGSHCTREFQKGSKIYLQCGVVTTEDNLKKTDSL